MNISGISNVTIEEFISEEDDDFKKDFISVFFSNHITHFLSFYRIIKEKGSLYPFAILNTNRNTKPGRHWWNILNIHPSKQLSLFDRYDLTGFQVFHNWCQ